MRGADGIAANHHAFEHRMGVAFEQRTIHESTRIAFVGIANDIFFIAFALCGKTPFEASEKASAPTPSEPRIKHRLNDLLGGNF